MEWVQAHRDTLIDMIASTERLGRPIVSDLAKEMFQPAFTTKIAPATCRDGVIEFMTTDNRILPVSRLLAVRADFQRAEVSVYERERRGMSSDDHRDVEPRAPIERGLRHFLMELADAPPSAP